MRLRRSLMLGLQRRDMALRRWRTLPLLLWGCCLMRLLRRLVRWLLRFGLVVHLHGHGRSHIAICRKRVANNCAGWAAMVDTGKLSTIRAGNMLILDLRPHRRGVCFVAGRQFGRPCAHLQTTGSPVVAHTRSAATAFIH